MQLKKSIPCKIFDKNKRQPNDNFTKLSKENLRYKEVDFYKEI